MLFTVPQPEEEETIPVAPLDDGDYGYFRKESARPAGRQAAGAENETNAALDAHREADELVAIGRAAVDVGPRRSFWGDVAWTFLLFTDPGNLVAMALVAILYAIIPVVSMTCFGWVCLIIIYGWLCSYWFNIIVEAASGEDSLPRMAMTEGVVDDVILPLLRFVGATVLACSPAIAYSLATIWLKLPEALGAVAAGASAFAWPMVLLVVAIGGFCALARVDLIAVTIARTFLPYVAVCLLVGGALGLHLYAYQLTSQLLGTRGGMLVRVVVTSLLQAYFGIVSMRIVGLYYHHFKSRFAWSWG